MMSEAESSVRSNSVSSDTQSQISDTQGRNGVRGGAARATGTGSPAVGHRTGPYLEGNMKLVNTM